MARSGTNQPDTKLDKETLQGSLRSLVQSAEDYIDNEVSPARALASKYYKGEPLGNEEEGRSQIVMTTVRDTVMSMMPSFLRQFFGAERAVEFVPQRPEMVAACEQASAYITQIALRTPGALDNIQGVLKDGLVRRLGFVKWWAEQVDKSETYEMDGLVPEQLVFLDQDPSVSYTITGKSKGPGGQPLLNVSITRQNRSVKLRWSAVPPEEVLWSRNSRSFDESPVIAHRREPTVSDLVAMGFDYDKVVGYAHDSDSLTSNAERIERKPRAQSSPDDDDSETADPTSWKVPFYEVYTRIDEDRDRFAELRRYYMIGQGPDLIRAPDATSKYYGVPVNSIPLAAWTPDPEPHTVEGQSIADLTMDLQRVDTALMRGNLDSLGLSLHPRVAFRMGDANVHDVLNTEIGAAIRTEGDPRGAIMEFTHTYVGKESFPLIEHVRRIREERTGRSMEAQGLNAEALQSSAKEAVAATVMGATERVELIGRMFSENILVRLFQGLYVLAKEHQDYETMVRINGKFVPIDPRSWDTDVEVTVNLMLGGGLPEQRQQKMAFIVSKQEFIIQNFGPGNPMVNLNQYTSAIAKLITLLGEADAGQYITVVTPEQAAQTQQQAAATPPKPDPNEALAQAQMQEIQANLQMSQQRLQLDMQKFNFEQEIRMEQLRQDFALREKELELKYNAKIQENEMEQFIQGHRDTVEDTQQATKTAADAAATDKKNTQSAAVAIHTANVKTAAELEKAKIKAATDIAKEHIKARSKRQTGATE